ncbi:tRNA lysidine(34) synthetase TilS [Roseovarius autotrophicus]|uniref:tRNA lysidine(34) synthetase TilS n=1 Tax=Roseovarius autotrophicus TaxID=2824121 RepID=UPI00300CABF0
MSDGNLAGRAVADHFAPAPPSHLGVAVSGGSDSLALLHLLNDWRGAGGPALRVATVDHGLRAEAEAEAEAVAQVCAALGLAHDTLRWKTRDAGGNLPDQARRARYRLLADWAQSHGFADVAIGHTMDDLTETFLMRLARGAGIDGLSAMRARWQAEGVTFHRPMLGLGRAHLRELLRMRGVSWIDDPTNADPDYDRTQARAVLAALAPLGLDCATLAGSARRLAEARQALAHHARQAAELLASVEAGDLLLERRGFDSLPDETARRLLVAGLRWMTGHAYPPRGTAMTDFLSAARDGRRMTLRGCVLSVEAAHIRLSREYNAVTGMRTDASTLWDGRWHATGPGAAEIAALGPEGLRACPDWHAGGMPHASALAAPGLWQGGILIAAPLHGWANGWDMQLARPLSAYLNTVICH